MTRDKTSDDSTFPDYALPVGTQLSEGQFTVSDHLGAGGFGITYKAHDNVLGRTVVIKECFPADFCLRQGTSVAVRSTTYTKPFRTIVKMFMREAQSLAKLRHPNVVGVHGAFEERDTAYMVLDLIDGDDLLGLIQDPTVTLSPARVKSILVQLLDAIEKVHDIGLLHRDIAPDNIILETSGAPVLIDFGAARGDASHRTRAISSLLVVKDGYSPQEFYVAGSDQSPSSDLYSLAATFYHLISGEVPPHSQTRLIEIAGRKSDPCTPLAGRFKAYDDDFLAAIDAAMQVHPGDRIQTAARWKSLIADAGDPAASASAGALPSVASISFDMERTLTRLVEETNDEVRRTSKAPPPAADQPAPPPAEPPKPDWIDEFNRDADLAQDLDRPADAGISATPAPATVDLRDDAAPNLPAAPVSARSNSGGVNWVDRALEKQERVKKERESMPGGYDPRTEMSDMVILDTPGSVRFAPMPDELTDDQIAAIRKARSLRLSAFSFLLVCFTFYVGTGVG